VSVFTFTIALLRFICLDLLLAALEVGFMILERRIIPDDMACIWT